MADLLDDQADHLGRGDDAVGGGAFELKDPVARFIPAFGTRACGAAARAAQAGDRAADRAGARLAPAHAHRGADLRLPSRPPGRRALPRGRLRVGLAARPGPRRLLRRLGRAAAAVPAGHASGTTRSPPTCSAAWSRSSRGQSLDGFFAERISGRWACATPASTSSRSTGRPAGGAVLAGPGHRPRDCATTRSAEGSLEPPALPLRRRRARRRRRATTSASRDAARRRRARRRAPAARRARCATWRRNHLPGGADLEQRRPAAVRRDDVRRGRLRPRVRGRARPGARQGARVAGRVRLGRRGQHVRSASTRSSASPRPVLTQLLPSSTYPLRSQLRQLIHQALTD